jgi:hypothetical protein
MPFIAVFSSAPGEYFCDIVDIAATFSFSGRAG